MWVTGDHVPPFVRGIVIFSVVAGSPAIADTDLGVGTEVGVVDVPTAPCGVPQQSRRCVLWRDTLPGEAVDYLLELADARVGGYWGSASLPPTTRHAEGPAWARRSTSGTRPRTPASHTRRIAIRLGRLMFWVRVTRRSHRDVCR